MFKNKKYITSVTANNEDEAKEYFKKSIAYLSDNSYVIIYDREEDIYDVYELL